MRISYRIRKNDGDTTPAVRNTDLCTPSPRPAETGRRHRRARAIRCANTAFRRGKTDGRRQLARLRTPPGSFFRTSSSSPLAFHSDLAFSDVPLIALLILKSSHEIQRRQGRKDAYSMPFERQAITLNRHAEKQPQILGSDCSIPTSSWPSPSAACTAWTIRYGRNPMPRNRSCIASRSCSQHDTHTTPLKFDRFRPLSAAMQHLGSNTSWFYPPYVIPAYYSVRHPVRHSLSAISARHPERSMQTR